MRDVMNKGIIKFVGWVGIFKYSNTVLCMGLSGIILRGERDYGR